MNKLMKTPSFIQF